MAKRLCSQTNRDGSPCTQAAMIDKDHCFTHDPDRPRCGAKARYFGSWRPCDASPVPGGTVCRTHGGASPQAKRTAAERLAEQKAREIMTSYGRKIETTATQALLDEVQWTAGHVAWLRERVQEIEQGALVWGVTSEKTGGHDEGVTSAAEPHVWLKLYQQERSHLVRVCAEAIKAGIEERRVRLAESQGELVAKVIRAILGDLDLTPEQQERVPAVVPRRIRELHAA